MKTRLSLVGCEIKKLLLSQQCNEQVLVSHYGLKPSHDGNYTLCPIHREIVLRKVTEQSGEEGAK